MQGDVIYVSLFLVNAKLEYMAYAYEHASFLILHLKVRTSYLVTDSSELVSPLLRKSDRDGLLPAPQRLKGRAPLKVLHLFFTNLGIL